MSRPPKPVAVLNFEKRSHRTKEELSQREAAEKALLTGVRIKEQDSVKLDPSAHKEFMRLRGLLTKIGRDDALYQGVINRYCKLKSECEQMEEKRETFYASIRKAEEDFYGSTESTRSEGRSCGAQRNSYGTGEYHRDTERTHSEGRFCGAQGRSCGAGGTSPDTKGTRSEGHFCGSEGHSYSEGGGFCGSEEREKLEPQEFYALLVKLQNALIACDRQVQAKRKMMLDIEKENIMTIASSLRSIPKTPQEDEEDDPLMELAKIQMEARQRLAAGSG